MRSVKTALSPMARLLRAFLVETGGFQSPEVIWEHFGPILATNALKVFRVRPSRTFLTGGLS